MTCLTKNHIIYKRCISELFLEDFFVACIIWNKNPDYNKKMAFNLKKKNHSHEYPLTSGTVWVVFEKTLKKRKLDQI